MLATWHVQVQGAVLVEGPGPGMLLLTPQQHQASTVYSYALASSSSLASTNSRPSAVCFECVVQQACNLDVNANPNANKAINWRRGSGKSAGNFPAAMEEV